MAPWNYARAIRDPRVNLVLKPAQRTMIAFAKVERCRERACADAAIDRSSAEAGLLAHLRKSQNE
jgi:hypothetical protein